MKISTIQQLQDALQCIGLLDGEFAEEQLDEPTRAALAQFQNDVGLRREGEAQGQPDAQTLSALEESMSRCGRFILRGWVLGIEGPLPEVRVRAEDRDINDLREPLGDREGVLTDQSGRFKILYTADQFARGDKDVADVMLSLQQGDQEITGYRVYRLEPGSWPPRDLPPLRLSLLSADEPLPIGRSSSKPVPLSAEELQLGIPARPVEELKILVGLASDGTPSEYEELHAVITPLLRDQAASELNEEKFLDISFVAREIQKPYERINEYVDAWKLAREVDIRPEIFYGLLRSGPPAMLPGLAHDLATLLEAGEASWREKLDESFSLNLIPSQLLTELDGSVVQLRRARVNQADRPMGQGCASLNEFLGSLPQLQTEDERHQFLDLFHTYDGPIDSFWMEAVPQTLGWNQEIIEQTQTILQLAEITSFNLPLFERILSDYSPSKLEDLTTIDANGWMQLVSASGVADDSPGDDVAEQQQLFAERILQTLQTAYPNRYITQMVSQTSDTQLRASSDLIQRFFDQEQSMFDLRTTPVSQYLRENGSRVFGGMTSEQQVELSSQLMRLQRTFQLSTGLPQMQAMLELDLDSAYKVVTRTSQQMFGELYAEKLGGLGVANAIYARATTVHSTVAAMLGNLMDFSIGAMPKVMQTASVEIEQKIKDNPIYSELFGSIDLCACEHCRSMYSPAAYLVDLLAFLDTPKNAVKPNPLDVLIGSDAKGLSGRRPDIAHIQLTCHNTNTRIPYIDLVIEILESYIAHNQPFPFNRPPDSPDDELPHPSADELGANPVYLTQDSDQSAAKAAAALRRTVYPLTLPFNTELATARVYLEHLGTTREAILRTFALDKEFDTLMVIAAETLGLSPQDFEIITGSQFDGSSSSIAATLGEAFGFSEASDIAADFPPHAAAPRLRLNDPRKLAVKALQHYLNLAGAKPLLQVTGIFEGTTKAALGSAQAAAGVAPSGEADGGVWMQFDPTSDTPLSPLMSYVPIFLERTGLTYPELVELLRTRFLNPSASDLDFLKRTGFTLDELSGWIKTSFPALSAPQVAMLASIPMSEESFKRWADAHRDVIVLGVPGGDDCNLDATTLRHLDGTLLRRAELLKLSSFIRLWRRLEWPLHVLDRAYTILFNDSFDFMLRLADAVRVQRALDIEPEASLNFWGGIDTHGNPSAYDRLFRNKAASRLEPIFILDETRSELDAVTKSPGNPPTIADHVPSILSAFRIRGSDLDLLLSSLKISETLNLANLSMLYRYVLLAKSLSIPIPALLTLRTLSGLDPFAAGSNPPATTLAFIELVRKVQAANYNPALLDFIFRHHVVPPSQPEQPTAATLQFLEALRSGLAKIEAEHIVAPDPAGELCRSELSIIESNAAVVDETVRMIDGSVLYTTKLAGLPSTFAFPDDVRLKATYQAPTGILQFQGVMTPAERATLVGASASLPSALQGLFKSAIGVLFDSPRTFFNDSLAPYFVSPVKAAQKLLDRPSLDASLRPIMLDSTGTALPRDTSGNLPPLPAVIDTESGSKFSLLLEALVPRTRRVLKTALVMQGAADVFGIDTRVAAVLLRNPDVMHAIGDATEPAINDFLETMGDGLCGAYFTNATLEGEATLVRTDPAIDFDWTAAPPDASIPTGPYSVRWTGLVAAPQGDEYTFRVDCADGVRLWVGSHLVIDDWKDQPFATHTGKRKLEAGSLYPLRLEYYQQTAPSKVQLMWCSSTAAMALIPGDRLFTGQAATLLTKAAFFVSMLRLDEKEILHFCTAKRIELNKLPLNGAMPYAAKAFSQWLRLVDYVILRQEIPRGGIDLIDVFEAAGPEEAKRRLADATGWRPSEIDALTGVSGFDFKTADFTDEQEVRRLPACIKLMQRLGITANRALEWARIRFKDSSVTPSVTYWACTIADAARAISLAQDIRNIARAKHDDKSWIEVARPLSDVLREQRKAALLGYVLAMPSIIERNIGDSSKLFEFFLVDVDTTSCTETSRIKQAISSVQLFIHRCLMGLEDHGLQVPYTVLPAQIDEPRWRWMQREVLWEANQKVFRYPENWLKPELRDDRTPFFRELESDLLQSDLTDPYVVKAMQSYLEKLDDVARLEICGVREDPATSALHVFGRMRNTPHIYYHRSLSRKRGDAWDRGTWSAWEKLPLDIDGVDDGPNGELSGVHLLPVIWNQRLYAFWPTFCKKPDAAANANLLQGFGPIEQWNIRLSWSEFFQGKWLPREHSDAALVGSGDVHITALDRLIAHEVYKPIEKDYVIITTWDFGPFPSPPPDKRRIRCIYPNTIIGGELNGIRLDKEHDFAELTKIESSYDFSQYLPSPADHLFAISSASEKLVFDTYQRYRGVAKGKKSVRETIETIVVKDGERDARQTKTSEYEVESSRPVFGYRWIGRFSIDGCRNKVLSSPGSQDFPFASLIRPRDSSNYFNWMRSSSQKRFEINPSPVLLNRLPSRYTVLDSEPDKDFTDTSPFFFQDSQRVFLVVPTIGKMSFAEKKKNHALPELPPQQKPFNPKLDLGRPYALVTTRAQAQANPWTVSSLVALATTSRAIEMASPQIDSPAETRTMSGALSAQNVISSSALAGISLNPSFAALRDFRYQFLSHWHPHVCEFIRRLKHGGIAALLDTDTQLLSNDYFSLTGGMKWRFRTEYAPTSSIALPLPAEDVDFNNGAYSKYNWELFFHAPLMIAQRLSKNQRFAEAQRWYHFIFNPLDNSGEASPARFWKFLPFKLTQPERLIDMLDALGYQGSDPAILQRKHDLENQIDEWAHDPFNPHLIARLRPGAYMKNVVMGYIDNLIAWADYLYRQDTLESINEATHLYIIAASQFGQKWQKIPGKSDESRKTFAQLRPSLDALSNAHIAAETLFPFATSDVPMTVLGGTPTGITTSLFFCLPPNDQLLAYWDRIEDRLFKIRHCMNIEGVVRQLPLYDPPIDPALLVDAKAKGVDLNSVLNERYTPLPFYRFEYMLPKALEMCSEVRSFGAALLAAIEKRDSEALAQLRTTHEGSTLAMMRKVKASQLAEAQANRDALIRLRAVSAQRYMHYQGLLGYKADGGVAPGSAAPIVSDRAGDNRLPEEIHQQLLMREANEQQQRAAIWDILANAAHYGLPDVSISTRDASTSISFGGSNIGAGLTAIGHSFGNIASTFTYESNNAAVEASFRRRDQSWVLESNIAARDIEHIDKQIAAAYIRIAMAERDLDAHDKQIEQNEEMRAFLRERKYTQEELYVWMQNELTTLHLKCYEIAYQWAKQSERCYHFATGTDHRFVEFGTWDSLRKGLLSGERLYLQLKQMERSYIELNRRDYELTRDISLATVDPMALIRLRQTGQCEVNLPETLFDLDFPGHYMRRLKSVALSIPCILGPYTGVNCTLTLLRSEIRKSPLVAGGYRRTDDQDTRFILDVLPTQSIATSKAQNDTGTFELNFRDERFLPFEGGGAISKWRLALQNEFRQFDYDTIADVVFHIKYTARDGGALLNHAAIKSLKDAIKDVDGEPLLRLFSLRHEFAAEWYDFTRKSMSGTGEQFLVATLSTERFPFAFQAKKIVIDSFTVFIKVRTEFLATHNESTLKLTLEPGPNATPGATPIALTAWNGLLRGEVTGGSLGQWTIAAWLESGGGARTRPTPAALDDIALVTTCTCS